MPSFFFELLSPLILVPVHDLFDVKDNKSISLEEVLEGLRYVMEFRIKGGCQRHLDIHLMKRLCEALLLNTGHTEGHLLRKRTTPAADMAFFLFGDFLEEGIIVPAYCMYLLR